VASAYVDTSCLVAIALDEPGARNVAGRLAGFDRLVSSNLLEAELWSACARMQTTVNPQWTADIVWLRPRVPLTATFGPVLDAGYLRGADLYHVATALHAAGDAKSLTFLTLDDRQRAVAAALGFAT